MIVAKQYDNPDFSGYYNVGPDDRDCFQAGALVDIFIKYWGDGLRGVDKSDDGPHEAGFLKLDCTKLKSSFGWEPKWNLDTAIKKVVEWTRVYETCGDVRHCMETQIAEYMC